ncbi:MAG: hypothetical protein H7Y07_06860 [Pyrinomonadaceae bacterium]|nr:hypothetical protein [Sphingobacteriaceae bacterium]
MEYKIPVIIRNLILKFLPSKYEPNVITLKRIQRNEGKLKRLIPDFGTCSKEDVKSILEKIASEMSSHTLTLKKYKLRYDGKSASAVIEIKLESGENFIVKFVEFKNIIDVIAETTSLMKLQTFKSTKDSTAKLVCLGKCQIDSQPFYVIVQTYLNGISLGDLLSRIAYEDHYTLVREKMLNEAIDAFTSLGTVLGGFHLEHSEQRSDFAGSRFITIISNDLKKFILKVKSIKNIGIDVNALELLVKTQLLEIHKLHLKTGYMFLDPHFGNILWDKNTETGVVYLIDSGTCFYSFCNMEVGCGIPEFDVFLINNIFFKLRKNKLLYGSGKILRSDEIDKLKSGFSKGYSIIRDYKITKQQASFFTLLQVSWYMNWFLDEKFCNSTLSDIDDVDKKRWISVNFYLNKLRKLLFQKQIKK